MMLELESICFPLESALGLDGLGVYSGDSRNRSKDFGRRVNISSNQCSYVLSGLCIRKSSTRLLK